MFVPDTNGPAQCSADGSAHLCYLPTISTIRGVELTATHFSYRLTDRVAHIPVMFLLLAGEHLHDGLPHLLVDADVEDGVDEAVAVQQGNNLLQDQRSVVTHHEDDGVGPQADQEGECDDAHNDGYSLLLSEEKQIFPIQTYFRQLRLKAKGQQQQD